MVYPEFLPLPAPHDRRTIESAFAVLFDTPRMSQFADEAKLARLGYKQEFKRHFTPLEVFGISFSIIGIFPSIA